jgi:hypothetical protein
VIAAPTTKPAGRQGSADRRRRMAAAGLAAVAEAGLIFLPVMQLSSESARSSGGPLGSYAVFLPLYVLGVVMWAGVPPLGVHTWIAAATAVGLGLAQSLVWGNGDAPGTAFVVVLALLVVLRMVTLAARDWREPVRGSFFWGAVAALVEIAIAGSATLAWRSLLPVVVVLFFAGSLASRAASLTMADRPATGDRMEAARTRLLPIAGLSVLAGILALAALLGGRHGLFQVAGGFVFGVFAWVVIAAGYVLAKVVLVPLSWMLAKLHFSLNPLRHLIHSLTQPAPGSNRRLHHVLGPPWVERLLGLALLIAASWGIVWLIRLRWRRRAAARRPIGPAVPTSEPVDAGSGPRLRLRRPRLHRELPADAIRRWYAEALLLLERRGLGKRPDSTPGEYLRQVTRAFPQCRTEFEALTRTYEDVRYGSLAVDRSRLQVIESARGSMMEALRRSRRADQSEQDEMRPGEERQ